MEVVEVFAYLGVLILAVGFEMVSEKLSEEHLANSDHAAPSSISHKR